MARCRHRLSARRFVVVFINFGSINYATNCQQNRNRRHRTQEHTRRYKVPMSS